MGVRSVSFCCASLGRSVQALDLIPRLHERLSPGDEIVFVDFDFVDQARGALLLQRLERLTMLHWRGALVYPPNLARNVAALAAVGDVLVFGDIDFDISAALVEECRGCGAEEFLTQPKAVHSFGFVAVRRAAWARLCGWEEGLCGYGCEDFYNRQSLAAMGLRQRVCREALVSLTVGENSRVYDDPRLNLSAVVNARIGRCLRALHPWRANINRNWGHGGAVVVESEARRRAGTAV